MCQHCCRLEWTPCPTIPLSCPLCPMRLLSLNCERAQQKNRKRKIHYTTHKRKKDQSIAMGNQLCRGISDLYSNVVSAQLRVKASQLAGSKLYGRDSNGFPVKVVRNENAVLPTRRKEIPVLYEENPNSWACSKQVQLPIPRRKIPSTTVNPYILRKKN